MAKKLYTVAEIAKITGYNRSTVTRWIDKNNIKNAQMQANAPAYSAQVLAKFKESHSSKDSKPDQKQLLLAEKDARIKELQDEVDLLKNQLKTKDSQIESLTSVTKQAQSLNLADKDPKRLKELQNAVKEDKQKLPWYKKLFSKENG